MGYLPHAAQAVRPGKLRFEVCSAGVDSVGVFSNWDKGLPQAGGNVVKDLLFLATRGSLSGVCRRLGV